MVTAMQAIALALAALASPDIAAATQPVSCHDLMPATAAAGPARPLAPEDLARLRDIGSSDVNALGTPLITLSPDGRRIAFQLRRGDPERNAYCQGIAILDLRTRTTRVVDQGGDFFQSTIDFRGKADFPMGVARTIVPRWSPDGSWVAFLKRVDGHTQVWRADADGSGGAPLIELDIDVEDFRISGDGAHLIFSTRPALAEAYRQIEHEGRSGFHYDDRYSAGASNRPFPAPPIERVVQVRELATGGDRPATPAEAALLPASVIQEPAHVPSRAADGRRAWLDVPDGALYASRGRLVVDDEHGRRLRCEHTLCDGVSWPWWTADGRIRFMRRDGWADASTAFYEWTPGADSPRRLWMTDDVLADCVPEGDSLVCLREGSSTPRRIERIDPTSGRGEILFDPNPEFRRLQLGGIERLHLTNAFDQPSVADLVLPVGYRPGTLYPLVVVQYDTRGFLRGGTGDDYPIQAFANRGYAVLSVSRPRPPSTGSNLSPADVQRINRENLLGFAANRRALSSIETGVRLAIDRGIADPARIGISGMSDGGTVAAWALLHSDLFNAAAMSSCCFDTSMPVRVGPAAAREFYQTGYPRLVDRADDFWDEVALSRNARRMRTPILLQMSDNEYLSALESFTALREVGAPIDLFVFPEENHTKWQPAHRLAIYRRSLDWFDYWLRDQRSTDPARQTELGHWDTLRRNQNGSE